jgi:hypothetical protein
VKNFSIFASIQNTHFPELGVGKRFQALGMRSHKIILIGPFLKKNFVSKKHEKSPKFRFFFDTPVNMFEFSSPATVGLSDDGASRDSISSMPGGKLRSGSTLPAPDMTSAPPTPEPHNLDYTDLIKVFVLRFYFYPVIFSTITVCLYVELKNLSRSSSRLLELIAKR